MVVLIGAYTLGQASPNFQSFASARGAAYKVFNIIDHVRNSTLCITSTHHFNHLFAVGKLPFCNTEDFCFDNTHYFESVIRAFALITAVFW